jgi:hypothetical protein
MNTGAESRLVARAIRARPAVQSALENADRLREAEDAAVLAARLELAESTKQLLDYGSIGQQLTGLTSEELRWLARRPSTTEAAATSSPSASPRAAVPASDLNSLSFPLPQSGVVIEAAPGRRTMSVRETVRDAQRRLAELDAAYARAVAKLDRASARRDEVLAEQDRLVAITQDEVDRTVSAMAEAVGVQLTAGVLGLDPAEVRRLFKSARSTSGSSDADASDRAVEAKPAPRRTGGVSGAAGSATTRPAGENGAHGG